ncbi:MAG: glycosyltransferase family 4 protein [Vicinamibacterales bacterium]
MGRRLAMLKLLVVTNDFPPRIGGIEQYVAELARHLSPDVSTTVITSNHLDAPPFDRSFPARVIRWAGYPLLPSPRLVEAVVEHVTCDQVDVLVFGATFPLALIAGAVGRRTAVPIVLFTHGVEPALTSLPGGSALLRQLARHATIMTVLSRWAEHRIRSAVGSIPRIELLPSGVDAHRFRPGVAGTAIRHRYGLGAGPVIVSVARLVPRKGHDRIIGALPGIAREFPAVRLLIVGTGPSRRRLERLTVRHGVASHVVFAGAVSDADLPACFAAGDVFAMPCRSRWAGLDAEGLGTVFLEAAAVGRPAVAGQSGGAPEAVLDGETGLVVDARASASVEAGVLHLLRSADEARAMGANGASRVHRELTWPVLARRLECLLHEASAKRR